MPIAPAEDNVDVSDEALVITSGTGMGSRGVGELATEDALDRDNPNSYRFSELTGEEVAAEGVSVAVVRLPQVHTTERQGMITATIRIARRTGVSA